MIKSQDLRTGNCVLKDGKICRVNSIFGSSGLVDLVSDVETYNRISLVIGNIQPITLTESILLKCGFKQTNILNDGTIVFQGTPYLYFKDGTVRFPYNSIAVQYLHQLQNVIFYHQGKELEIKL